MKIRKNFCSVDHVWDIKWIIFSALKLSIPPNLLFKTMSSHFYTDSHKLHISF